MSSPPVGQADVTRSRVRVPRPLTGATLAGVVVVTLLGMGVLTEFGPQMRLDATVSEALYAGDGRARTLDWLLEALTAPGSTVARAVVLLPVVVWLFRQREWRAAVWVLLAAGLVGPVTSLLKDVFGRIRPPFEDGGARLESLSYPSGHSSGIAALVTVALVVAWPLLSAAARRTWLVVGIALVLVVGLTRMWLGVHYLSDVLGGWALGISWCLLVAVALGALPGGRAALPPR